MRIDPDEAGEEDHLPSGAEQKPGNFHGMHIEGHSSCVERTSEPEPQENDASQRHAGNAWVEQQPSWRKEKQKPQVPPAVAPAPEVWRTRASILVQGHRHFGDAEVEKLGFYHHFRGKFHAGRPQVQHIKGAAAEPAHPAVEIVARTLEEEPSDKCQHRIANPAVFPRHGPFGNRSSSCGHPATHDQIGASAQLF